MHTQLIVCNQIAVDPSARRHMLGYVINQMRVAVFPSVISFSLLLKIIDMPKEGEIPTEIRIVNSFNGVLSSQVYVHRNYRKLDAIPGVDQNFDMTVLVEKERTIFIECYINEEKTNWYPLQIINESG